MKRIKFENFSLNWYRIGTLFFAFIFIMIGSGLFFSFKSQPLFIIGLLLVIFELSRIFWFKHFVKYNSKGIYIRINSFLGKTFNFKNITQVKVTSKHMKITHNGNVCIIDLNRIDRNDVDDLAEIIIKNSNAQYKSEVMHEKFINNSN